MKPFTRIAIVVFAVVSILHLARLIVGWEVLINGVAIPLWLSAIGFVVAGALAAMLWRESRA